MKMFRYVIWFTALISASWLFGQNERLRIIGNGGNFGENGSIQRIGTLGQVAIGQSSNDGIQRDAGFWFTAVSNVIIEFAPTRTGPYIESEGTIDVRVRLIIPDSLQLEEDIEVEIRIDNRNPGSATNLTDYELTGVTRTIFRKGEASNGSTFDFKLEIKDDSEFELDETVTPVKS